MTVGDKITQLESGEGTAEERARWYRNVVLMLLASAKTPLPVTRDGLKRASEAAVIVATKNAQGEVVLGLEA